MKNYSVEYTKQALKSLEKLELNIREKLLNGLKKIFKVVKIRVCTEKL